MTIDDVYRTLNFITNKNQSGRTFRPAEFNTLAKVAQLDFISKRLGNVKALGPQQVPAFGYKSNRKVHEDLRPLIYGPLAIPITPNTGTFMYPYNYIWPDAVHKLDWTPIMEIDADQYPHKKKSSIYPPTADYPIIIHRGPYGFVDPYTIGQFAMTYVRAPRDPHWAYTVVNDQEVYDPANSVDFEVNPYTNAHQEILLIMLSRIGINLNSTELATYAIEMEKNSG